MERAAAGEGRSIREKAAPFLRREAARRLRPRVEKFFKERDGGGGKKKRKKRGRAESAVSLGGWKSKGKERGKKKKKKEETRDEERESRCVRDTRVAATTQKRFLPLAGEIERCLLSLSLSLSRYFSRRLEESQSTRSIVIIPLFLDWWALYSAVFPGTKTSRSPYSRIHCRLSDAIPFFFLATSGRPALLYSYCT